MRPRGPGSHVGSERAPQWSSEGYSARDRSGVDNVDDDDDEGKRLQSGPPGSMCAPTASLGCDTKGNENASSTRGDGGTSSKRVGRCDRSTGNVSQVLLAPFAL